MTENLDKICTIYYPDYCHEYILTFLYNQDVDYFYGEDKNGNFVNTTMENHNKLNHYLFVELGLTGTHKYYD